MCRITMYIDVRHSVQHIEYTNPSQYHLRIIIANQMNDSINQQYLNQCLPGTAIRYTQHIYYCVPYINITAVNY